MTVSGLDSDLWLLVLYLYLSILLFVLILEHHEIGRTRSIHFILHMMAQCQGYQIVVTDLGDTKYKAVLLLLWPFT